MRYRWVILFFGILAYGTSQFARQNFNGIQPYIAADLKLNKGDIGQLASIFFWSYAIFQMPWGIASDKFGSRAIVGLGILLTAATMVGFATGQSEGSLLFWRAAAGVVAAAVYVALTGSIARWFPGKDRSFSQATLGGVGGALGEGTAYFLLPVLAGYLASAGTVRWREGMNMIAVAIAIMGILCIIFLKSAPAGHKPTTRKPFDWKLLGDAQLWCYAFIYSGFVIGIRGTQTWMAVYATDVYVSSYGLRLNQAVVSGGLLAFVAYSLVGRTMGCPLAGKISDMFAKRGVSRTAVLIGWLIFAIIALQILSMGVSTIWALGIVFALLGALVNLFSLVPAAISETYGSQRTASISSFANTLAQFSGATALAVSGYVGVSLNSQPGNALGDYRGIWLSGMVGMAIMATLGVAAYIACRAGWAARPQPSSLGEEAKL